MKRRNKRKVKALLSLAEALLARANEAAVSATVRQDMAKRYHARAEEHYAAVKALRGNVPPYLVRIDGAEILLDEAYWDMLRRVLAAQAARGVPRTPLAADALALAMGLIAGLERGVAVDDFNLVMRSDGWKLARCGP